MDGHVVIVGAGIVGLNAAFFLRRDGWQVTVVARDPVSDTTSCGNAGAIAACEVIPNAGAHTWRKVPGWLLDPLGPLAIRWAYLPRLLPWLRRHLAAGSRSAVAATVAALAGLHRTAFDDHGTMVAEAGLGHLLRRDGALFVYRSAAAFAAETADWDLRRRHGYDHQPLDRDGLLAREPALGPEARAGCWVPDWAHYLDPRALSVGLTSHLRERGVRFVRGQVTDVETAAGSVATVRAGEKRIAADRVVVAAGAWSARLSKALGEPFPLESERGYNTTLPDPGIEVSNFITFAEDHFVLTPMAMGLRIGGAVEFAGLEAPPKYARARALADLARRYLPGLNVEGGKDWMGNRPQTPDSIPVIGPSARHRGLFYAFGHGHLGLTGSAPTGRVLADLLAGRDPDLDLTPFRIDRYR
ncbi:MAG: FAD-binding oxidoreductase [Hyphomicrobiales bacterium]|nr:FAD-binding oxidoreductase [Hyphomicrobiales bacterium]